MSGGEGTADHTMVDVQSPFHQREDRELHGGFQEAVAEIYRCTHKRTERERERERIGARLGPCLLGAMPRPSP